MKNRGAISSRKIIAAARRLGVPERAWKNHIKRRKDVSYPIAYSFSRSLGRYGVAPDRFWSELHG